jgi:hypothetical protein
VKLNFTVRTYFALLEGAGDILLRHSTFVTITGRWVRCLAFLLNDVVLVDNGKFIALLITAYIFY